MARKPKSVPSPATAASAAEQDLPGTGGGSLGTAPGNDAPARRGRKPKAAAPEPIAMPVNGPDAGEPDRGRRGRKAKPSPAAPEPKAKRGRPARRPEPEPARRPEPEPARLPEPEPAPAGHAPAGDASMGDAQAAGMQAGIPDLPVPEAPAPETSAAPAAPAADAPRAKSAAHWDRARDAVQFDWPAIERTASQEGPNQAMAKLLIAARAEGANSRWPL